MVGAMLLSGGIAQGTPTADQVVINENSTSLTATFNGSSSGVTITRLVPDEWLVEFPVGSGETTPGLVDWLEPGGNSANSVEAITGGASLLVQSDLGGISTGLANGATDTTDFKIFVGTTEETLDVTFNDNADVPDATSTLALLSFALCGLGILGKRCGVRIGLGWTEGDEGRLGY